MEKNVFVETGSTSPRHFFTSQTESESDNESRLIKEVIRTEY